jgi:hypothetical protein
MGRLSSRAILDKLLEGNISEIKEIVDKCIADQGCSEDEIVEILAGFMCERCDNMLANVEDSVTREKIIKLSNLTYRLFLKAHQVRRKLDLGVYSVEDPSGLNDEVLSKLKALLSSGEYMLVVLPKEGYLFFKSYYPSKHDAKKLRSTVKLLEEVVGMMKNYASIRERYGGTLKEIEDALRMLRGYASLDMFMDASKEKSYPS